MVGAFDSVSVTHNVMECLMPEQIKGLAEMNKMGDIPAHSQHKKVVPLSDEARIVMEERMKPEYELYQLAQDRLDRQYEECTNRI